MKAKTKKKEEYAGDDNVRSTSGTAVGQTPH